MKHPPFLGRGLLVLSLALAAPSTWADDDCDAPLKRWQTREAVHKMAAAQGWQIQQLKIDDGCYELRGTDAQGRGFKAKVDPETLKVLKMKPGHHHQRARGRGDDDGDARKTRAPPPAGAAVPAPSHSAGSAPRVQTE